MLLSVFAFYDKLCCTCFKVICDLLSPKAVCHVVICEEEPGWYAVVLLCFFQGETFKDFKIFELNMDSKARSHRLAFTN